MFPTNHDIKGNIPESEPETISFTFPKALRLNREREIKRVFSNPDSKLFAFPVMALVGKDEYATYPQFLFSVGKKKFKRAVHRNRIRRLMKEAVRLSFGPMSNQNELKGVSSVIWIYTGHDVPEFEQVYKSIRKIFHELVAGNR
ncbi:MAG: ribonuclease P protein component [Flavobacteriales bacterium]|nr:ribonuclease P protein component [Flavobacteriales bacterium]